MTFKILKINKLYKNTKKFHFRFHNFTLVSQMEM